MESIFPTSCSPLGRSDVLKKYQRRRAGVRPAVETDRFLKIRRLRRQKNLAPFAPSLLVADRRSSLAGSHSFVARTAPPLVARNCRRILEVSIWTRFRSETDGRLVSAPFRAARVPPARRQSSPHTIVRAPSAHISFEIKSARGGRREGVSATGCDRLLASITSSTRRSRRSRGVRCVSEPIPRF